MLNFNPIVGVMFMNLLIQTESLDSFQPQQIHLSYGGSFIFSISTGRASKEKCKDRYFDVIQDFKADYLVGKNVFEMVATWSTFNQTDSIVEYGIGNYTLQSIGKSVMFTDSGLEKRSQFIHRVKLQDLQPNSKYIYHCGSKLGWSAAYWFKTAPANEIGWSPRLAIYGDLGNENAQSLPRLQEEVQNEKLDAIIHVGDFAYDMDFDNGRVGDEFMRQIESISAYVPYMTCPGNHEQLNNFSHYRARFSMPGDSEGLWYSFNMGPVHFVALSTEVYYNFNYGIKQLIKQYDWLLSDLKEASSPENRAKRPWIVTFGHRPMYCSNNDFDDCRQHDTVVRKGLPFLQWFGLEKIFFNYGIDLSIWAHEHSYERLWPVFDYNVYNGSLDNPYYNPRATVHITTGSAAAELLSLPQPPAEFSLISGSIL